MKQTVYDFTVTDRQGNDVGLSEYQSVENAVVAAL